jgi:poly(A) polymerase
MTSEVIFEWPDAKMTSEVISSFLVPEPIVVPRADHPISRRNIDPDALRVLYRLQRSNHVAYLVGGSVRDLLLGRVPKDFDIATDAHPYQIKRLFRNCWIIGRRFRLAHVKFGPKTIEVATFRKIVPADPAAEPAGDVAEIVASAAPPDAEPGHTHKPERESGRAHNDADGHSHRHGHDPHGIIHRDNTFGTPEEDAFRRDFTINALFYDAVTRSVIDYVGGLGDLERRTIRSIGDPRIRFVEDPVRMLRAAVFAARLGFDMDPLVIEAIAEHRGLIMKASPSRLMEEYFKILRSGYAEPAFRALHRVRLLELITPEFASPPEALWAALARLDRYRQRFPNVPLELTNTVLVGSLLVPTGALDRPLRRESPDERADRISLGMLPVARRELDRLRQITQLMPRLLDPALPPRVARNMHHRPVFSDTVVWLEIFGDAPDAVERWKQARHARQHAPSAQVPAPEGAVEGALPAGRRRRRRRRRRGRGRGRESSN